MSEDVNLEIGRVGGRGRESERDRQKGRKSGDNENEYGIIKRGIIYKYISGDQSNLKKKMKYRYTYKNYVRRWNSLSEVYVALQCTERYNAQKYKMFVCGGGRI